MRARVSIAPARAGAAATIPPLIHTVWPALLVVSLAAAGVAAADDSDPPGLAARISYAQGQVSLQPAGMQDWVGAVVNRPMTTGDKLWSDADSRAEVEFGPATVRLANSTGFSFLNLSDQTAQLQMTAGTLSVHVNQLDDGQTIEIDTPNLALSVLRPGDYRVEVNDAGDATVVKVASGEAEATGGGQDVLIDSQQKSTFTGTNQLTYNVAGVGPPDDFDAWTLDRDRRSQQALAQAQFHAQAQIQNQTQQPAPEYMSPGYVSPDVVGSEDLSQYGAWQSSADYGPVWFPSAVPGGWAPYMYGSWVWVSPWGWTWVDQAPWGFAPFHYGRWTSLNGRWGWVPGPRAARSVYAPALVAWVGSPGAGASVAIGGGAGVAWMALAPREVYVPAYHASRDYVTNINVTNTAVNRAYVGNVYDNRVPNIRYMNRSVRGAVVGVSQANFTAAQPVDRHALAINPGVLATATFNTAAPAIAPEKRSVLGSGFVAGANVRRPPAALLNRTVVARQIPPPAPVAFDRLQQAIRANGGRPLAAAELARLQTRAPAPLVRVAPQAPARRLDIVGSPAHAAPPQPPAAGGMRGPGTQNRPLRDDRPPAALDRAPAPQRDDRPPAARDGQFDQPRAEAPSAAPPIDRREPVERPAPPARANPPPRPPKAQRQDHPRSEPAKKDGNER